MPTKTYNKGSVKSSKASCSDAACFVQGLFEALKTDDGTTHSMVRNLLSVVREPVNVSSLSASVKELVEHCSLTSQQLLQQTKSAKLPAKRRVLARMIKFLEQDNS